MSRNAAQPILDDDKAPSVPHEWNRWAVHSHTPVLSLVLRSPTRAQIRDGFGYHKLVAFTSVIVTSLGDRRRPFFFSWVSTRRITRSEVGAWVGYKRLYSTRCDSPPTPASRFNVIGRAAGRGRERPTIVWGKAACISISSLSMQQSVAVLFGSGSERRRATMRG